MKISLNLIFAFFVLVGYAVSDLILPPLGRTVLKTLKESKMIEHTSQRHMSNRVCGSPASDAYASVDRNCLIESPTATWFMENVYGNKDMLQIHIEKNADYDGIAVRWGLGNKVAHVEECAQMCLDHKVNLEDGTGFGPLPCNAFVYCREERCFEPDAYRDQHAKGDCWLKFTEGPGELKIWMLHGLAGHTCCMACDN